MGKAPRETPVHLAEKLLQIRTTLGLSQNGMLERLGLADRAYRNYIVVPEKFRSVDGLGCYAESVGVKSQGIKQNLAKSGELMKNTDANPANTLLPLAPQLNAQHPLLKLAQAIDWSYFEREFNKLSTAEPGRPPLPTRLLVGLHYLKALYDESDESVVAKWIENPYWQFFCGEQYFQHDLPCHRPLSSNGDSVSARRALRSCSNKSCKPLNINRRSSLQT